MLGVTILSDLNRPEQALWPYGPEWVHSTSHAPEDYLAFADVVLVGVERLCPPGTCLDYGVAVREGTIAVIWRTFDGRLRGLAVRRLPDGVRMDPTPQGCLIVSEDEGLPPPLLAPEAAAPVDLLAARELSRRRPADDPRRGTKTYLPDPTEQAGDPGPPVE